MIVRYPKRDFKKEILSEIILLQCYVQWFDAYTDAFTFLDYIRDWPDFDGNLESREKKSKV